MEDNTLSGQQTWRRILKQKSVEIEIPGIRLPNLNHGLFEYETNDPILTISQSSDILEIPEEECEKINLMTDLIQLGFRLSKKSLKIPGIKRPEIYYAIVRYQKGDELEIKKMPTIGDKPNFILYHKEKGVIRGVGDAFGPMRGWIYLDQNVQAEKTDSLDITRWDTTDTKYAHAVAMYLKYGIKPEFGNFTAIPETILGINQKNQVVCRPNTKDMPVTGRIGTRGGAKSLSQHTDIDQTYRKGICCIDFNDNQAKTFTRIFKNTDLMRLPDRNLHAKMIWDDYRIKLQQLPYVFLHPYIEQTGITTQRPMYENQAGFYISLPFKEIVSQFTNYYNLGKSQEFFIKIQDRIASCKTKEEVTELFKSLIEENASMKNSVQRIERAVSELFTKKIVDIANNIPPYWKITKQGKTYNLHPLIALSIAGVIPCLVTNQIIGTPDTKKYLGQYISYILNNLWEKQTQDADFKQNKFRFMFYIDEIHEVLEADKDSTSDKSIMRLFNQGRNLQFGVDYITQTFKRITKDARRNTTYCLHFKGDQKAEEFREEFNVPLDLIKKIPNLPSCQCIAVTRDQFKIYDKYGRSFMSKEPQVLDILPPLSRHAAPDDIYGT